MRRRYYYIIITVYIIIMAIFYIIIIIILLYYSILLLDDDEMPYYSSRKDAGEWLYTTPPFSPPPSVSGPFTFCIQRKPRYTSRLIMQTRFFKPFLHAVVASMYLMAVWSFCQVEATGSDDEDPLTKEATTSHLKFFLELSANGHDSHQLLTNRNYLDAVYAFESITGLSVHSDLQGKIDSEF